MATIAIPSDLLPQDGRFGCGPSLVRDEVMTAFAQSGRTYMGTSHRKPQVKSLVGKIREGLASYFALPDGYTVALGNGGATLFWDAATFGLIERQSAHAVFGEFSSKFAASVDLAGHLESAIRVSAEPGDCPTMSPIDGVDTWALTHNETSTGVAMPITRPSEDGLVLVDATSGAGALAFAIDQVDAYYFSPQKAFGADGGLWLALLSPAAQDRIRRLAADRPTPPSLDLALALSNSEQDQTYNTPAVASLFFLAENVTWLAGMGLDTVVAQAKERSAIVYDWADQCEWATPFVANPEHRSPVVATIDLDGAIDAGEVNKVLRAHGILDTDAYRKLGRNQLRIGLWPATSLADTEALVACLSYVGEALAAT